jgi:nicotinamidase-related amidase
MKLTKDYFEDFQNNFNLEPIKTALIAVDLQYGSASRTAGLGKLLQQERKSELGSYRFDRIEQFVVPNVRRLLAFFRENQLRVIHLTLGSLMNDYSDIPPPSSCICACQEHKGGRAGARDSG